MPTPLTTSQREKLFGRFTWTRDPTPQNPERIQVTDSWAVENLVTISLPPPLSVLAGAEKATFHRRVVPKFLDLIFAWDKASVLDDIIQWSGAYARRFIRGSQGRLSAHAFGAAFDINAAYNRLGHLPAPLGAKGSVLRLVPIATDLGWCWGGDFKRRDGMHFELGKL